jgi:hypothetical protein
MTQLQIAEKLREQIKEQWPYVSTILALYANNTDGKFTERIQDMVDRLLPREVFYCNIYEFKLAKVYYYRVFTDDIKEKFTIESLPINQVLFSSEDNMFGHLK